MGLEGGEPLQDIAIDRAFVGSCTNGRIEDLRAAAEVARGRRVAPSVRAMVVPGSTMVKRQAEAEGLDRVFIDAGFEWRNAGCSMCVAMNGDMLAPGERCASTTNRNFEGRQGAAGAPTSSAPPWPPPPPSRAASSTSATGSSERAGVVGSSAAEEGRPLSLSQRRSFA